MGNKLIGNTFTGCWWAGFPKFKTVEEFERWFVGNSGSSFTTLRKEGRKGFPCSCEDENCTGWQMTDADDVKLNG